MRKLPLAALALPLLGLASAPAEATSISFAPGAINAPGDALYQDFEGFGLGTHPWLGLGPAILGDNPRVVDTVSGSAILGAGEVGNRYVAIAKGGILTLTFSSPGQYLGLLWGTIDGVNSITFLDGGQELAVFTGFDLQPEPDHTSAIYANFFASGGTFTSVVLSTGEAPFEFDDVRVTATPLPAALGLFGVAVVGMGMLGMRRRRA